MRMTDGLLTGDGHLVGFVTGGDPVERCEPVAVLIPGDSRKQILKQARSLGVWDPSVWGDFRIPREDVSKAVADPHSFCGGRAVTVAGVRPWSGPDLSRERRRATDPRSCRVERW